MQKASPDTVFLNIPYDDRFRRLYLAYISGLISIGLDPRVTLGIPGGERRLDRILVLIKSCAIPSTISPAFSSTAVRPAHHVSICHSN